MSEAQGKESSTVYAFNISAIHIVAEKEEVVSAGINFKASSNRQEAAHETAIKVAQERWPISEGYYDHFAS